MGILGDIASAVSGSVDSATSNVTGSLIELADIITSAIDSSLNAIGNELDSIASSIGNSIESAVNNVRTKLSFIEDEISGFATGAADFAIETASPLARIFIDGLNFIGDKLEKIFSFPEEGMEAMVQKIMQLQSKLGSSVINAVPGT